MADEDDDDQDRDETPDPPQRLFTLTEAERARQELEPFLVEAMDSRKKLSGLENELAAVAARIMMMGGVLVPYEKLATVRMEHNRLAETLKSALNHILETGCLIKDLDVGLLDFPAVINQQDVYLCWKLGEDRIRFYHRQDEGFASRKPLDPRDLGPVTRFSRFGCYALLQRRVPARRFPLGVILSEAKDRTSSFANANVSNCDRPF